MACRVRQAIQRENDAVQSPELFSRNMVSMALQVPPLINLGHYYFFFSILLTVIFMLIYYSPVSLFIVHL